MEFPGFVHDFDQEWDYKKFTYFIYTCTSMKLPLNNTITCSNFEKWFILVNHLSTNICFNKALNFIFSSQGFEFLICSPPVNRREVDQKPLIRNNPKFRFKINPIPVFKIYPLYKWRTTKPVSCMNLANCLTVYTLIDISDWRWSGGHCQRSEWVFLQVYSCNHLGRNRSYPRW